jgi:transcriptional regulator with XRE-family HTH domain
MSDLQSYLDTALKKVKISNVDNSPTVEEYDIYAEICQLVIDSRNILGITQKQLANKSGVSQSNISKIENGTYRPSIATLKKITDAMGKRLTIDFTDEEEL